jgi:hypothetical protein
MMRAPELALLSRARPRAAVDRVTFALPSRSYDVASGVSSFAAACRLMCVCCRLRHAAEVSASRITILGMHKSGFAVLQCGGSFCFSLSGDHIRLENLVLRPSDDLRPSAVLVSFHAHVTIINCHFEGFGLYAPAIGEAPPAFVRT